MKRICKYKDCRHEVEEDSDYCKYHLRIVELEESMPAILKELIEKIREDRNIISH